MGQCCAREATDRGVNISILPQSPRKRHSDRHFASVSAPLLSPRGVNGPPPEQSSYNSWASLPAGAQGEAAGGGNYFEGLIPPIRVPWLGGFALGDSNDGGENAGVHVAGLHDGNDDEDDGLVGQVCLCLCMSDCERARTRAMGRATFVGVCGVSVLMLRRAI